MVTPFSRSTPPQCAIRSPFRPAGGRIALALLIVSAAACLADVVVAQERIAVAVAPFANRSNTTEYEELARGLADMLMTDLSVSKDLRLVERERLDALVAELKLNKTKLVDKKTAQKMGKLIGAELVVTGALTSLAPNLRIDARLVSVESGEVMATAKASGPIQDFFKVEAQLARELLKGFGVALSPLQRMRIGKPPTRNLKAMHAYSKGLVADAAGKGPAASKAYKTALAADPGFAKAKKRLAALEQRVAGLEKRTEAVERAGGLILKPRTAVDHFSNHSVHASRGEDAQARRSLAAALRLRPDAVDALWRHASLSRRMDGRAPDKAAWTKVLGNKRALPRAKAVSALVSSDREGAQEATASLLRGKATDTLHVSRYLRLRALSPPVNKEATAVELAEAAALAGELGTAAAHAALRKATIDAKERKTHLGFVDQRVKWFASFAPGFRIRRRDLAAEPVAIGAIENQQRQGRPFVLQVRIAEVGPSEVVAVLPGRGELPLKFVPRGGAEGGASLWQAPIPKPQPMGWQTVGVRYIDRRGAAVKMRRKVLLPSVWNGSWRRRGEALGRVVTSKWPMLSSNLAALKDADQDSRLLVDPIAGVWTRRAKVDVHNVQVLYASQPTVFATGSLARYVDQASGREQLGLLRAIALDAGTDKRPKWLAVGTGRYVRERERDTSRYLSTAESLVGERGPGRRALLAAPMEHALGLLTAARWTAGVDAFLDAVANHTDAATHTWLAHEIGAYAWIYCLAAARRSGHRLKAMRALAPHMRVAGQMGEWLKMMAGVANGSQRPQALLDRAAELDGAPRAERDRDPWRYRAEAAAAVVLSNARWNQDAQLRAAVAAAQQHVSPVTLEWPLLAAAMRAHTASSPEQVQVRGFRGTLPSVPIPAALGERVGTRKAAPARRAGASSFWIDRDEISVDEYSACVRAGGCQELLGSTCGHARGRRGALDLTGDQGTGCLPVSPNPYPVTDVLRRQAADYCRWRGGKLPTHDQWRTAALGPDGAAAPWGTGPLLGSHVNLYDAVSCELRHSRKVPTWCAPREIRRELLWDGWMHVAPRGSHVAGASAAGALHMLGNVREWLAGKAPLAAGCSYLDPPAGNGTWCASAVGPVKTPSHVSVGFRCVYDEAPKRSAEAQAGRGSGPRTGKPSIDWVRVPAGEFEAGAKEDAGPHLELGSADSKARKALADAVAGASNRAVSRFVSRLEKLGLTGKLSAHLVQELASRGRWKGRSFEDATQLFLATIDGGDHKEFKKVFNEYVNKDSMIRSWARKSRRKPKELNDSERRQALFEGIVYRFRGRPEAPRPRGSPRFHDSRGVSCSQQPIGACVDPMGLSGSRLRARPLQPRKVTVAGFKLMKTEVTQAMFRRAMGWVPSFSTCEDCPVERVTWHEATNFCKRIGARLPTEHEWARAARGGGAGLRHGKTDQIAWTRIDGAAKARDVAGRKANAYGLHDMLGGVWEWVADLHRDSSSLGSARRSLRIRMDKDSGKACIDTRRYGRHMDRNLDRLPWQVDKKRGRYRACYSDEAAAKSALAAVLDVNPRGPAVRKDRASKPQLRVVRGGSRGSDERLVTAAHRAAYRDDQRSPFVGFRCAK